MASEKNGTLYIGFSSDLKNRVNKHKEGAYDGFTKKYNVKNLVYYETYGEVGIAICKEKQLKKWKREWKINLIEKDNPGWRDLYNDL
ncbi:MAG: Excinuclease ABC C subunit domain protein [Parcubacteria group bacterium GW2011_GWE2_39_37]|uniref:Excinuclease ABC C subunit domain protein n=1 Tax=Candidatus Falkowbacteria bacterium GW2011_GWF2_39_8 TaxID=1618642 RepID=A0A0G0SBX8_9BACT|nr:MAG: Excinuclease ABC C subunit domain protein [Parcubacteria group bacterium GW2011_GWE2_39_37]KKR32230.1 MAG: Excinuclease ABC C subunit domain protein [Candidatus Falkowbacteria bacterium GW2011_GWF2_39_8]